MTTANEIEELWIARYEKNRDAYPQLLSWDPFRDWERNRMPESSVENELLNGLRVAYAWTVSCGQAVAFFERACEVAQRVFYEDKLKSPLSSSSFPLNRGILNRAFSYARAILFESVDVEALRQSSRDFEQWCKGYGKREWDSQAQANYLATVRLAFIAGEIDRARELLKNTKSFKWHDREHALWKRLADSDGQALRADAEFAEQFREYFNQLRDPRFIPDVYMETDILRLELALLRDKYLMSEDGVINFMRAVDSVPRS